MLERQDIERFTAHKQELQVASEILFTEMMADFDLTAFLADPRGYTRAFMAKSAGDALRAVLPDAYRLGDQLGRKAGA